MNVLITGGAGFIGSNLAAQVAVTTSVTDPRIDFEINTTGTLNVIEALDQPVYVSDIGKAGRDLKWVHESRLKKVWTDCGRG